MKTRARLAAGILFFAHAMAVCGPPAAADEFADRRAGMVDAIAEMVRLDLGRTGKSRLDPAILEAMRRVPRHLFVPAGLAPYAYLDRPLPVGYGQTVSQPYIVALMTDLARVGRGDRVLLIGVGGGYHAAILRRLAGGVRCVEMQPEVAAAALSRLSRAGYGDVEVRVGDPYFGWRGAQGDFDAIVVRQAMDFVPGALVRQLGTGGRLVVPVGRSDLRQDLVVVRKTPDGGTVERRVMPVRFTRMPGGPRI